MAYQLKGRKSVVRFDPLKTGLVEKESESYRSSVTSNPIEKGSNINDHVSSASGSFSISGVIIGGEKAIQALISMQESGEVITYLGVSRISNLVITSLKFDRSYKNKKGASFAISFSKIKTASPEYVPINGTISMVNQDKGKSKNQQLKKTTKAGMTTVSSHPVSSAGSQKLKKAYSQPSSSAPTTRITKGYSGTHSAMTVSIN